METITFATYAEAQEAIAKYRLLGRKAVMLNEHTGHMRDASGKSGFEILVENHDQEEHDTPLTATKAIKSAPRTIAWIFMISAAVILFSLGLDWLVNAGRDALTILLLGLFGTCGAFIAAVMWAIVLSDLTAKFRQKS